MHGYKRQRRMAPNDTAKIFQVNLIGLIGCCICPDERVSFCVTYYIKLKPKLPQQNIIEFDVFTFGYICCHILNYK